ncbi:MAG: hypothetical protein SFY56_15085 [Bacteroidota bacterium]|nr:hypothetical protein [Bacteroidota bacterium]
MDKQFTLKIKFSGCLIILFSFLLNYSSVSQKKLDIDIVFGVYVDDHNERTFKAEERNWILKNKVLVYHIDAHNKRYSDTLKMNAEDINTIIKLIEENKLIATINKDLTKDFLDKNGWSSQIKGKIVYGNKQGTQTIKSNSSTALEEDKEYNNLKKLEDLFYQIIETKRKK